MAQSIYDGISVKQGKLVKRGRINKAWRERHFEIYKDEQRGVYFKSALDARKNTNICGTIDLTIIQNIKVVSSSFNDTGLAQKFPEYIGYAIPSHKSRKKYIFHLVTNKRTYILSAINRLEYIEWINYFHLCIYGGIIKQGWLKKQSLLNNQQWNQRYFVLNKYNQLKYYDDQPKTKYLGYINCKKEIKNINYYDIASEHILEIQTKTKKMKLATQNDGEHVEYIL